MTYIFMAVHCPAPGKLDEVYASMQQMAASAAERRDCSKSAHGSTAPAWLASPNGQPGQVMLDAAADEVHGAATSVSGPAIAMAEFTAGRTVWDRRRIGAQESAVVAGALDDTARARAGRCACTWNR